jgi:gliding motility-associated-like protein
MRLTTVFSTRRIVTAFLLLPILAFAQPVNDDCADAVNLGTLPTPGACNGSIEDGAPITLTNQSTVGATGANPYSSIINCSGGGNMTSPAVDTWYTFVSSGTTVNINISGFPQASIGLWSGGCGNLTPRGCLNIGGSGNGTLVVTQTNPGEVFYIQISGGNATATDANFTLAVDNDIDCNNCLQSTTLTATPAPVNGTYLPGQVVNFCFTVDDFSQQNTNWFHGVQITMGSGWTGVISNPIPAADCPYDPPGPGNAGAGTWAFYNSVTSQATGQTFGQGFYFDNSNVSGSNPGQNFGDVTNGNCSWTFCWTLTVDAGCTAGADLSVTVNTSGDGESGSWGSVACAGDYPTVSSAYMVCCGIPTTSSVNESCPGASDGTATAQGQGGTAPYDYVWENASGTVIYTQNNINGPSTATGLTTGTYTVTVTDASGCVQIVDVVVVADPCATCPTYGPAVAASSACGGQMYDFTVPNTSCNGTLSFTVVGNYGSTYGSEITWQVVSVATGAVVASGGPGTNGGVINMTVNLDPNITGNVFNLIVNDSYGDGFNGIGGTISVTANGSTVAGPITGNFGSTTNQVFAVNIDISPTTLTIITPSGNVVDYASNCADHSVQFNLANTNYCTPIVVNLPWSVVCDLTGAVLSSGTQAVTVYPQIATSATNVVDISWNTATCQWTVTPQNDCDMLDIGTVFTISPNPAAWPANTCAGGSQVFTVDYLGVAGSPDCCETGGPLVPITYNATTVVGNASVQSSIYGGVNNSALVTIPGSGTGGNSTSFSMNISGSGYCYPNPAGTSTDQTYYIGVWVDGVQVLLQGPLTGGTFNVNVTQAMLTGAGVVYNENSVIQVYLLPNLFNQGGNNTTYVPGVACGSLTDGQWTVGTYNITMNASYVEQTAGPANCTFTTNEPYTCCINNGPVVPANGASTVNCVALATQPAAPVVVDACGNNLTPTIVAGPNPACEGTKVYTYTYTDCDNNQSVYTYTYTIDRPPFTVPANGSSVVSCVALATQPTPPAVVDACGTALTPTVVAGPNPACEGTKVYTFTYTDCAGNSVNWTYTYTIDIPIFNIVTPNGSSTVNCPSAGLVQPTPPAVTNFCGTPLTPVVTAPSAVACEGPMVWTFTYTDCAGNSRVWTYTYNVDMPAFTLPANGGSTVNCLANALVQPTPPVVTSVCGTVLTPTVSAGPSPACEGTKVYTFTYTDCAGNTANWIYTYTIDIPTFTIAAAPGASTVNCPADGLVQPTPPAVTNACGTAITPTVTAPSAVACEGPMVWTFTYTDCAGNTANWTYTYTVDMPTFSIAAAPGASTVNCPANAMVQPAAPVVTDFCGNALTPTTAAPTAVACEGPMVWTFTYTDCAGNTANWTYTYTVDMPAFAIASAPGASTVNCPSAGLVQPAAPVVTDLCGNTLTPTVSAPTAVACEGPMVWTFTYTDCAGNTANWTYTYTVDMPTFVIATAPGGSTVNCPADGLVQPAAPAVMDLCGNALTPTVTAPSAVACEGPMVWTFTYIDCAGNTANWTYTYTVDMPTFTIGAPNSTSSAVCVASIVVPTPPAGIVDACGNTVIPVMTENADPVCIGDKIYTFTYTDCAGNVAVWTATISVNDNVPPTGTAPANQSLPGGPIPPADVNLITNEADNCTANPVVTWISDVSDNGNCPEIITRTYRITDDCGNYIDVIQTFTLGDAIMPTASNPADINVECLSMVPAPDPNVVTDESDNGSTPIVTFENDMMGGGSCPDTLIRTYRVTDDCGNYIFVTQLIIIEPVTAPVVPANGSSTVNCVANAMVQPVAPAVTDVCGNALVPVVAAPTAVACEGNMVWTFTYTDCAGNTADWTYTYTVDMPTFVLPANGASTVNCVANAQVQPIAPAMTDVCGNTITPTVTAPAAVACEGPMVWTFTYTDCAGNTANWTYTYTVDMPTFVLPANGASTVNCVANAQVQPAAPVVNDVCGNAITPTVTAPAAVACEGPMVWTFTYTDCAGNTANWTYTYTVDMPGFVLPANGASTVNCVANAQVQPVAPAMNDACGNAIVPTVSAPTAVACEGPMVWTFTYTDCAGNTANWTYTYTVDMPAFILPANGASTVNCVANAQVQPAAPAVSDVCGNAIVPTVTAPTAVACEGNMVWTFTYTDCAGNTANWTYTYTVDMPTFVLPANAGTTVSCVSAAQVQPVPPVMNDVCGNAITPTVTPPAAVACEGTMPWVFTYTDCAGNTANWTYTYTIDLNTLPVVPANQSSAVQCIADVVVPVPPAVVDACGNSIVPVMTEGPDPVCVGDKVYTFTYTDCAGNASVWTYTYSINDNIAPTASDPIAISVPGANDVPAPDPLVVTDEADNCTLNPVVAWVSDVSDGNVCNGEIITRVYSVTDDCGNVTYVTQYITIEAVYPPIDAGPDATICMGEGITLTANNPLGVPIAWNPSNPPIDGVEFFPTQTATYTVTADNLGCISTDQVTITVEELPVASFIGGEGGCAPTTVSFNSTSVGGSNLVNCVWEVDGNPVSGDCNGMSYTFTSGGYYDVTLTVTSENGCSASVTYDDYIFMESVPNASFSVSSTELSNINTELHTNNTSTGAVSYQWNFGDGSAVTNAFEPTHIFPDEESSAYVIELIAYSEVYGCSDTAWVAINVVEEVIFYVPNTFTPDGDSYNEYFKAIFSSGYDPYDFTLLIFDRWGEIIWESHNADIGWDGTYGGEVVSDGTYVWKIEFKTSATDERRMITGHVNVIK